MKTLYLVGVVLSGALAAAPAMADQGATVGGAASQFQAMHFIKGEVRQLSSIELREREGGIRPTGPIMVNRPHELNDLIINRAIPPTRYYPATQYNPRSIAETPKIW
jgi:hypothetical protein